MQNFSLAYHHQQIKQEQIYRNSAVMCCLYRCVYQRISCDWHGHCWWWQSGHYWWCHYCTTWFLPSWTSVHILSTLSCSLLCLMPSILYRMCLVAPKPNGIFCHVMQCVGVAYAVAMWQVVCLSHWCIVPRWLSRSSCDLHHIIVQFSHTKYEPSRGSPSSNGREVGKSRKIWPINAVIHQRAAIDSTVRKAVLLSILYQGDLNISMQKHHAVCQR